jgi:hypothetical protein
MGEEDRKDPTLERLPKEAKNVQDSISSANSNTSQTMRIVIVPSLIASGVTVARLIGELRHWPRPLVNSDVCGKAILGIVWLVPVFSVYFAMKLWRTRQLPRLHVAIALAVAGLLLKLIGTSIMERQGPYLERVSLNFAVTLAGLLLQFQVWPELSKILLAYGYLSRIPVAIVQFLAMRGAWGTHYDALDPGFPKIGFWPTYLRVAFVPNIFFMEAYTVIAGVLIGCVACALLRRAVPAQGAPV